MNAHRRLQLLMIWADVQESAARATRLLLEDAEDELEPQNVVKEIEKTSPRMPAFVQRPSTRITSPKGTYAFNGASAAHYLRKAFDEADSPEERDKVRETAKALVRQGILTQEDANRALKLAK